MITTTNRAGLARTVLVALTALAGTISAVRALKPSWEAPLPTEANLPEERMQDFRDALYFPIREFLNGGNPYDPAVMFAHWPVRQNFNLYQPYHLVLHLPFALPDYRVGAVAFALACLMLLITLAVMASGRARLPMIAGTVVISTLLVTSQVGKAQMYVGQVNPLIAVGAAGTLLLRTKNPGWASAALALAWLKPQFGLPLALLMFIRGDRKVALMGTGIAAAASLPVAVTLILRGGGVSQFLDVISRNLQWASHTGYGAVDSMTAQRVDLPAVFFRTTGWLPPAAEPLALCGVLTATALLARKLDRHEQGSAAADVLTCLGVVVALVHQPGDVLIAVPALTALAVTAYRRREEKHWWWAGAATLLLLVPFAHLYFVDTAVKTLLGARAAVTLDGVAVVAAWLVLAVFAAKLTRRAA
ncbi:glycosyltransferase 87 family protein [Lentzea kentuckyensis]|uniref:glycosyltransferase 87 family protein n=1 Tax=Lentzea kentuckyensis TaxID=360086 RepID=UPI001FE62D83|nr:glycosyltransferase 87 family protein [Lentzea kentuckyensis]